MRDNGSFKKVEGVSLEDIFDAIDLAGIEGAEFVVEPTGRDQKGEQVVYIPEESINCFLEALPKGQRMYGRFTGAVGLKEYYFHAKYLIGEQNPVEYREMVVVAAWNGDKKARAFRDTTEL